MSVAPVVDLDIARLVHLEADITKSEHGGLRARWEFGHELLRARDGKGRLPNGYLATVQTATGVGREEMKKRALFASRFPSEEELGNAITQFRSWFAIVRDALPKEKDSPDPSDYVAAPGDPQRAGQYGATVADPPWQYGNTATRAAAEDHYPTMSIAELCELQVGQWAAPQSHLYLWTTNGFLRESFDVMDAWGFTYKTTLVWAKPQLGLGNYFRSSTEYVLFGVKGGLRTLDSNQRNWFEAKRGRHSKKPGLFFDLVEKVSPGPYLEMFARERRLGDWDVWGNEV